MAVNNRTECCCTNVRVSFFVCLFKRLSLLVYLLNCYNLGLIFLKWLVYTLSILSINPIIGELQHLCEEIPTTCNYFIYIHMANL
jgi:hypothetical protein